jgi:hypothetical protein
MPAVWWVSGIRALAVGTACRSCRPCSRRMSRAWSVPRVATSPTGLRCATGANLARSPRRTPGAGAPTTGPHRRRDSRGATADLPGVRVDGAAGGPGGGADAGQAVDAPLPGWPEPVGAQVAATASGTSKSAVSRRFVARTEHALAGLLAADLSTLDLVALLVDGVRLAGHTCVVALGITLDGRATWRRSTATSWRNTSSSASFAAELLASSASHPQRQQVDPGLGELGAEGVAQPMRPDPDRSRTSPVGAEDTPHAAHPAASPTPQTQITPHRSDPAHPLDTGHADLPQLDAERGRRTESATRPSRSTRGASSGNRNPKGKTRRAAGC